jgi:lipopolysaccharide export system protein LptA
MHKSGDEHITYLRGNVHFFYDDIEFKSDRAEIYDVQQYVVLRGNVIVIQDTLSTTCVEAQYYHETQFLRLQGNVVMTETHTDGTFRRITANMGRNYRDKGEFIFQGNVFAFDSKDMLYGSAGYAFYNQMEGYGYMIQRPLVWRTGEDSLSISAEKIEFFQDTNRVVASFNVVTQNSEIRTRSNFFIYYGDEERLFYFGEPMFFSESGDGNADLITVYLEEDSIKEIVMEGDSFIKFSSDDNEAKDNWVSSTNMVLYYSAGKPIEFVARENVQSFIRQSRDNRSQAMSNNVSGEVLHLFFDDNSNIESLNITERIKGKYRFERRRRR